MKKVALMTWHHVQNYGTAYQAYALKTALEHLGDVSVDLINYARDSIYTPRRRHLIRESAAWIWNRAKARTQKKQGDFYRLDPNLFDAFYARRFTYTSKCEYRQDFQKLNSEYDCFICGSDQIWGPYWFDRRFFLDFVGDKQRTIAYAPSFGVTEIDDPDVREEMSRLIGDIRFLSLREEKGCELACSLTGRTDAFHAIDPVFLLAREEWEQMLCRRSEKNAYMLIFFLKNCDEIKKAIQQAEVMHLQPLVYHCTQSPDNRFVNLPELTPEELLGYIAGADYICTDSFHVVAMSLIFNKKFNVFKKKMPRKLNSQYERLQDLLQRLGANGANHMPDSDYDVKINYSDVNKCIAMQRNASLSFLKNAIFKIDAVPCLNLQPFCPFGHNERKCAGEYSQEFMKYSTRHSVSKMSTYGFSLSKECYCCAAQQRNMKDAVFEEPLFYWELVKDLEHNKSAIQLGWKYFYPYYCIDGIKVLLNSEKGKDSSDYR